MQYGIVYFQTKSCFTKCQALREQTFREHFCDINTIMSTI